MFKINICKTTTSKKIYRENKYMYPYVIQDGVFMNQACLYTYCGNVQGTNTTNNVSLTTKTYLRIFPSVQYLTPELWADTTKLVKIKNKRIHLVSVHLLSVNAQSLSVAPNTAHLIMLIMKLICGYVNICKIAEKHDYFFVLLIWIKPARSGPGEGPRVLEGRTNVHWVLTRSVYLYIQ